MNEATKQNFTVIAESLYDRTGNINDINTMLIGRKELEQLKAENKQLGDFVIEVGGFWGKTKSTLVGDDSLADAINKALEENAEMEGHIDRLRLENTKMLFDAAKHQRLGIAAQAVVDRWDTSLWRAAPATAIFISELRKQLEFK